LPAAGRGATHRQAGNKKGDLSWFGGMLVCQRQNINQNKIKIEG